MSTGETITQEEVMRVLPQAGPDTIARETISRDQSLSLKERVDAFEKDILIREYREAGGNVSHLARILKVDRANLHRKLKSYGIK